MFPSLAFSFTLQSLYFKFLHYPQIPMNPPSFSKWPFFLLHTEKEKPAERNDLNSLQPCLLFFLSSFHREEVSASQAYCLPPRLWIHPQVLPWGLLSPYFLFPFSIVFFSLVLSFIQRKFMHAHYFCYLKKRFHSSLHNCLLSHLSSFIQQIHTYYMTTIVL